ncbi:MAG TPA: ATP-grasp domain-containing protein [Terriglobia bacterium]|nr:ATP-grasp domain-containing protein [Terriglobia bacterium]
MTEISTSIVLRLREELKDFSIPFAPFETFDLLSDKWKLMKLAQELDIPIPQTHFARAGENLDKVARELGFPLVLKPSRSRIWCDGRWIKAKVKYASSIEQVKEIVKGHECFERYPFLVQQYIPGQGQGIFALYNQAKPVVFFAHRRLREKPPSGGVSVLSESVEVDPGMCNMARRILDAVKWHGVGMVEFKVSSDGTPFLMEVNARFWGSLQLAIDAGVNFPWLLYQLATGRTPDTIDDYEVGVRSRWLIGDVAHLRRLFFASHTAFSQKWHCLTNFLDLWDTNYEVNRWNDLRPFLFELRQCLLRPFADKESRRVSQPESPDPKSVPSALEMDRHLRKSVSALEKSMLK